MGICMSDFEMFKEELPNKEEFYRQKLVEKLVTKNKFIMFGKNLK